MIGSVQASGPADSVRIYMKRTPSLYVGLDTRQSFIGGHPVTISGAKFGLDYWKVGFYTGFYTTQLGGIFKDKDTFFSTYQYQSSSFEYYLYQAWRWQWLVNFAAGYGRSNFNVHYTDGRVTHEERTILPLEMGTSATVRFLRYFGVYAGFGVRLSPLNGHGFTGTYYSAGLTCYTGTMWRDTKKLYRKITH